MDRRKDPPGESQNWADYERLHELHESRIVSLCRLLLHDPDEARDVTQDVFLRAFEQMRRHQIPNVWEAWLVRVAVNACRDRQRSGWWKRWSRNVEVEDLGVRSVTGSSEDEASRREQHVRIWQQLDKLRAKQRQIFVLRCVEGWSTEETAQALGISTGSVKTHLFRAIRHLRRALEER